MRPIDWFWIGVSVIGALTFAYCVYKMGKA